MPRSFSNNKGLQNHDIPTTDKDKSPLVNDRPIGFVKACFLWLNLCTRTTDAQEAFIKWFVSECKLVLIGKIRPPSDFLTSKNSIPQSADKIKSTVDSVLMFHMQ